MTAKPAHNSTTLFLSSRGYVTHVFDEDGEVYRMKGNVRVTKHDGEEETVQLTGEDAGKYIRVETLPVLRNEEPVLLEDGTPKTYQKKCFVGNISLMKQEVAYC